MRRRSGALHCDTQEQLLELASNTQMGLFYNQRPFFKEVKFQNQWNINEAQNNVSQSYENFEFNQQQQQGNEQQKQLNRGTRYLKNCIVDKQTITCTIQICLITQKMEQLLQKILKKDSLLNLFIHSKETAQNCIYKHSTISSFPNSNVFSLEKTNVECSKQQHQKENVIMTPKNWLKQNKNDKMMELLIVKKQICLQQNTQIDPKIITIIHRIFIINTKFLQNPLIKIYLQKCHYVIDTRSETFKQQNDAENKSNSLYNKLFHHKSFFERDCSIFDRDQFDSKRQTQSESSKFKFVFHKIEERIAKTYMRKLNDILVEEKQRSCKSSAQTQK